MNKGFIKLSVLVVGFLVLIGSVGYLVSARQVDAYDGDSPSVDYSLECGQVTLHFNNPTTWLNVFDYRVDGEAVVSQSPWAGLEFNLNSPLSPGAFGDRWNLVPLVGEHNEDRVFDFDEESGTHLVEWRLAEGAEQYYYFDWQSVEVDSNCELLVCLDGQNEQTVPNTEGIWDRIFYSYPNAYEGQCEVPTPDPEVEQPVEAPRPELTQATAPQCNDSTPLILPNNVHVVRSGAEATVNFFTSGSNANIYFKGVNAPNWEHSVRDISVEGGYVSYTIHDLDPMLGYTFGIQAANSCAGGETVVAVVVDGPESVTFPFSFWEWL